MPAAQKWCYVNSLGKLGLRFYIFATGMQRLERFIAKHPTLIFFSLLLIAVPAFLINLGLLPLFADEPTRANVALEMILSRNFSVPTVGGEFYYNKPPFYNWILAGLYLLTGSFSEFVTRLPAIIPMFLFAATIYASVLIFLRDKWIALLSGMFFIVNGRMLIYDSMLGHIDIFYSWLTYISFMCMFWFYRRNQWFWLFLSSYIITAITFLCKGMPSVVFQGFTLLALLISTGNFRKLFGWQHILSGFVCVSLIALYFWNYSLYNPNLEAYFGTIWDQSSQRTAGRVGLWKSASHILLFPFEHLGHLFPASLLVLFCLHRDFWKNLWSNQFLKFIALTFLVNIVVYWLSPQTRPRYLLMLYPLLFIIWSYGYFNFREQLPRINRAFNVILLVLSVLVTLAVPAALFSDLPAYIDYFAFKVAAVFVLALLCAVLIYKVKDYKIVPFIALLLVVRLGFSWFVLPHRLQHDKARYFRQACEQSALPTSRPASHGKPRANAGASVRESPPSQPPTRHIV